MVPVLTVVWMCEWAFSWNQVLSAGQLLSVSKSPDTAVSGPSVYYLSCGYPFKASNRCLWIGRSSFLFPYIRPPFPLPTPSNSLSISHSILNQQHIVFDHPFCSTWTILELADSDTYLQEIVYLFKRSALSVIDLSDSDYRTCCLALHESRLPPPVRSH